MHATLGFTQTGFWSSFFQQSQFIQLAGLLVVFFSLIVIILLAVKGLGKAKGVKAQIKSFRKDENGSAMIEFVLVLPFLMILFMSFWQIIMMMTGNLLVHYSAFTATRSAIVIIPEDRDTEPHNTILIDDLSADSKFETIFQAAASALAPTAAVSEQSPGSMDPDAYRAGIEDFYIGYGVTPPGWVTNFTPGQIRYVANHTAIVVSKVTSSGSTISWDRQSGTASFEPRDAVGVTVRHEFPLTTPFVHVFFRDGVTSEEIPYTNIQSNYVLNLEGISPELPPEPEVPRRDP